MLHFRDLVCCIGNVEILVVNTYVFTKLAMFRKCYYMVASSCWVFWKAFKAWLVTRGREAANHRPGFDTHPKTATEKKKSTAVVSVISGLVH